MGLTQRHWCRKQPRLTPAVLKYDVFSLLISAVVLQELLKILHVRLVTFRVGGSERNFCLLYLGDLGQS